MRQLGARDFKFDDVQANPREKGVELALQFHNDDDHVQSRVTSHAIQTVPSSKAGQHMPRRTAGRCRSAI